VKIRAEDLWHDGECCPPLLLAIAGPLGRCRAPCSAKSDSSGMIEQHVTVLDGEALEIGVRPVRWWRLNVIPETLGSGIKIERHAVVVANAIFEFLAQFPRIKVALVNLSVAGSLRGQE